MALYLVTYDLMKTGQDFTAIHNAIKQYKNHWHIMRSVWIIKTDEDRLYIANQLEKSIDKNDKLIVSKITREIAWSGLSDEVASLLDSNFP